MSAGCVITYGIGMVAFGMVVVLLAPDPVITACGIFSIVFGLILQAVVLLNEAWMRP